MRPQDTSGSAVMLRVGIQTILCIPSITLGMFLRAFVTLCENSASHLSAVSALNIRSRPHRIAMDAARIRCGPETTGRET